MQRVGGGRMQCDVRGGDKEGHEEVRCQGRLRWQGATAEPGVDLQHA